MEPFAVDVECNIIRVNDVVFDIYTNKSARILQILCPSTTDEYEPRIILSDGTHTNSDLLCKVMPDKFTRW